MSCGRTPIADPPPGLDVEEYAIGYCHQLCRRKEDCGLNPSDACVDDCTQDELAQWPEDSCWAERVELQRCVVRLLSCEDVEIGIPEIEPGSPCAEWFEIFSDCAG